MTKKVFRNIEVLLSLLTLGVLGASFYFQYYQKMQPCPLCLMQRAMVLVLLFISLMGVLLATARRAKKIAIGQMLFAAAGMYFAGRQLWLQSLSEKSASACLPGLEVLMKYFSWQDVFYALFWGAGDCAEVSWSWLGLSMPAWSLIYFAAMFLGSLFVYTRLQIEN